MRFSYYTRLSTAQKRIYDESDRIRTVGLNRPELHRDAVVALAAALQSGSRPATARATKVLADSLTGALGVPPLSVSVRERRPSSQTGELHGLYQADETGRYQISVWMRTARRVQVVKFKTFLRTFLHELCHHLDYHRHGLRDSFHTEGFYARESSLLKQIYPSELDAAAKRGSPAPRLRAGPLDV